MKAIKFIYAPDREDVIRHAQELFTQGMQAHDRIEMIHLVAEQPAHARANFVRNRKRGGGAAYARGINVHEGDRDQRTKAAIQLFYKHQGQILPSEIETAVTEFVEYLCAVVIDKKRQMLAYDALLKPRQKQDNGAFEMFGPLINDEMNNRGFTILGFPILGEELIGRLWIFASRLPEEKERENAKLGMIAGLSNSYDAGMRICNQGKTQRLVVAVLQGRLPGVDIEGKNVEITTAQAVNMFFSKEERQKIDNLHDLLIEVNIFLNENILVNRDKFIAEINQYAKSTF